MAHPGQRPEDYLQNAGFQQAVGVGALSGGVAGAVGFFAAGVAFGGGLGEAMASGIFSGALPGVFGQVTTNLAMGCPWHRGALEAGVTGGLIGGVTGGLGYGIGRWAGRFYIAAYESDDILVIGRLDDTAQWNGVEGYQIFPGDKWKWSQEGNDAWAQGGIDRRAPVLPVSSMEPSSNWWDARYNRPTVYATELGNFSWPAMISTTTAGCCCHHGDLPANFEYLPLNIHSEPKRRT